MRGQRLNQVVVWDRVALSPAEAVLNLKDEPNEYPLIDQYSELRGADVKLRLYWDAMPLSGSLLLQRSGFFQSTLPAQYTV